DQARGHRVVQALPVRRRRRRERDSPAARHAGRPLRYATDMIDPAVLATETVRPLRRDEYDRLVALGYFEDEKIELLDGLLIAMSPAGAAHMYVITKLNMLFAPAVGKRALVRVQGPFAASDTSEPEPDLALVPNEDHSRDHASQAFLLVEVAESSLRKDRVVKASLYARAGIPEYWIVNLRERVIEVH